MAAPVIDLYTVGTPNGHKVSIILEELGIPYETHPISFQKNEQKSDWFLKINPNGRIPAVVDRSRGKFPVFESGAILMYLAKYFDPARTLLPEDPVKESEVIQWLMFQMSGVGPMQGQANHFFRYAPEKIPYGINRYQNETKRLYSVLEGQLKAHEYLAADQYTIADIATFPWVAGAEWCGVTLDEFPSLKAWVERIEARPAVQRGLDVPEKNKMKEILKDKAAAEALVKESSKWIMGTGTPTENKQ